MGLLSKGSPLHAAARDAYRRLLENGSELIFSEQVIIETFSVLSRSPKPLGVEPRFAGQILTDLCKGATIAPFRQGLGLDAIRQTLERGHHGGRVYDAVIALSVYEAGARVLLTWSTRRFHSIAPAGLEVREP